MRPSALAASVLCFVCLAIAADPVPPQVLKTVPPSYPPVARQASMQGITVVEVVVDAQGRPGAMRVLRGNPIFFNAALAALRQWQWSPPIVDGAPASAVTVERVEFFLGERERVIGLTEIVRDRTQVSEDRVDAIRRIAALPPSWQKTAKSTLEKARRDPDAAVAEAAEEALTASAGAPAPAP